jgi:DNA-binding response OmpR family regulator
MRRRLTSRRGLDLRLPVIDGLEDCRRLRNSVAPRISVLIMTAADLLDDRLMGFAAGTDDYMVKPFALPEFLARWRALVRRNSTLYRRIGRLAAFA